MNEAELKQTLSKEKNFVSAVVYLRPGRENAEGALGFFGKLADPMTVTITDENGAVERHSGEFMFALAGNGRWYGGGYCGAPKAQLADGLLDFVLIRRPPYYRIPFLVGRYKRGEHIDDARFADLLVYRRGTRIEIESTAEMVSNMDGNCVRTRRETYAVMPGALRLILPEGVRL